MCVRIGRFGPAKPCPVSSSFLKPHSLTHILDRASRVLNKTVLVVSCWKSLLGVFLPGGIRPARDIDLSC